MRRTTRDRFVLPIVLPVGILLIIGLVLFGFSRILLAISHNAATATALLVALAIVVMAGVVASRRYVRLSSLAGMVGAVAGVAMLAGGIAVASLGTEGEGGGGDGGGPGNVVQLAAVNIAFQPAKITVPAGEPFRIQFDNRDAGVQHNVEIFPGADVSGTPTFKGDLVTGPAKVTYDVPALDAGTYAFNCVVHPTMTGSIEAVEGGGGQPGGGGGGPSIQVSAQNIAFDTDRIELPADTPATIVFENKDSGVQHNIAIFEDDTLAKSLFKGDLVTGPGKVEYQIPPLPAGEYYFHCDVHPNMSGVVVVGGGGGGGGQPSEAAPTPTGQTGGAPAGGATLEITAKGIAFDKNQITLPAGQPSTIHFVNQDAGVQHNLAIYEDESLATALFKGDLVTGPGEADLQVPAIPAGSYFFHCDIHPNMNGTVTVE